jgi:glycosyltransferase involved in cell wall biosynthesis
MISLVIPVYNEVESLEPLHAEIKAVALSHNLDLEILFIDDGSKDGSWERIRELAARDGSVRGLRFRRNFGKAAALSAGFKAARGSVIITLDADLQDDPAEIPRFLAALDEGPLDVVAGWKKVRHDPWHKVYPSRVFNTLVGWATGVRLHDHNCGMKAYRAEVLREVRLYGELHRFIPVLAAARGFKVGEIVINHRPRKFGSSKYGMRRFIKGFLDLMTVYFLTAYGQRPQHLMGSLGLLCFFLGGLGMSYLGVEWVVNVFWPGTFPPLATRPLLIYSVGVLIVGVQLMATGLLAELITAYQGKEEDGYSVAERTEDREVPRE